MELENTTGRLTPVRDLHSFLAMALLAVAGILFWLILIPLVLNVGFDISYAVSRATIMTAFMYVIGLVALGMVISFFATLWHRVL